MTIIGLDIGYRYTNITNGEQTITFPSIVALVHSGEVASLPFTKNVDLLAYKGKTYLVGEAAQAHARYSRHTLNRFRTESDEYKILFLYALYRLYGGSKRNLKIVTGLPHADMVDKEKVIKVMRGSHRGIKINGKGIHWNVTNVVVIPQPLGTLANEIYAINGKGLLTKNPDLKTKASLVIDFGGLTIGFMRFVNGRYNSERSTSIEIGLAGYASTQLIQAVRQKHHVKISFEVAEEALLTGIILVEGKPVDVSGLVDPILDELIKLAISTAHNLWDDGSGDEYMFLSGGGVHVVADRFTKEFGRDTVRKARNPHLANAKGFYLFGVGLQQEGQL